jgi:hypothetical protein
MIGSGAQARTGLESGAFDPGGAIKKVRSKGRFFEEAPKPSLGCKLGVQARD